MSIGLALSFSLGLLIQSAAGAQSPASGDLAKQLVTALSADHFTATLPLPFAGGITPGQYPIGDATRWSQIVDNLAALVAEYDRTFVPAIEAAAGPSPEWYRPEA